MNAPTPIIYIVEDDPSFRKSMERLLTAAGYQSVVFASARPFLEKKSYHHPSCLILDVRLPDLDGLELQRRLIEQDNGIPIIFMTGHGSIPMSVQAMKRGAVDFLPKPFEPEDLLDAVESALAKDLLEWQEENRRKSAKILINGLTPRELEIMRWVISGRLNKEIAFALGITEKTVKVHRARVLQKLQVSSVAELVRLADLASITSAR